MLNKWLFTTLFLVLVMTACSERLRPIGCWEDQFQAVYKFKPQGVVTKKIKGELRPRYRGNWEMVDGNRFVLELSDQAPEKYTIVSVSKNQMTIKFDGDREFTWSKTSCL
ncbi:MAG: hypothetical protein HKP55_10690 [Gammaproteobacteria bacterium]|nr:hypothetical protein [Gammaproteobacteria bacterium]